MTNFKTASHKKTKILLLLTALPLLAFLAFLFYKRQEAFIAFLTANTDRIRIWAGQHPLLAALFLILAQVFQVFLAIIPAGPFQLAAGYAFGSIYGTLISMIGSALGSILVYYLVKMYGKRFISLFFTEEKINQFLPEKLDRKWEILMVLIYLIPGSPKDLLAYIAGLTNTHQALWIFVFIFGRIPSILISSFSGNALSQQQYKTAVILMIILGIFSCLGYYIYKSLLKNKEKEQAKKQAHKWR